MRNSRHIVFTQHGLLLKELELNVVTDQGTRLVGVEVEEDDPKLENKKREEKEEKTFTLSDQMKEDLILLVAILLILCITCSIVGSKVTSDHYKSMRPNESSSDLLLYPAY